jgi:hypothetical protein
LLRLSAALATVIGLPLKVTFGELRSSLAGNK